MSSFLLTSTYAKTPKTEKAKNTISTTINKPKNNVSKTWNKITCDKKPGAPEKMTKVKKNANEKITMINNVLDSLSKIIPLVTDTTIKTNLQQALEALQIIKNKYANIIYRVNNDPQSMCWVWPILKPYNEESKTIINNIREIFHLLKKK